MTSRRALVFDLDGTLIDSRADIAAATNYALSELGRTPLSLELICSFVGNGAPHLLQCIADSFPSNPLSTAEFEDLSKHFHSYYRAHPIDHSIVLPGAEAALALPGRVCALCTNKPKALSELVIAGLNWEDRFAAVVGGGDTPFKKPHRDPLDLVADLLEIRASDLIMIGDGHQDIGAGKAVGAHTIGVRGGFLDEELLERSEPDVILTSLLELPAYLEQSAL